MLKNNQESLVWARWKVDTHLSLCQVSHVQLAGFGYETVGKFSWKLQACVINSPEKKEASTCWVLLQCESSLGEDRKCGTSWIIELFGFTQKPLLYQSGAWLRLMCWLVINGNLLRASYWGSHSGRSHQDLKTLLSLRTVFLTTVFFMPINLSPTSLPLRFIVGCFSICSWA